MNGSGETKGSIGGLEERDPPAAPRRATLRIWLAVLLFFGAVLRVMVTMALPVGYDEVFVIAVGLEEMTGSWLSAILETPMQRSSALAPLWWWTEYLAFRIAGGISLPALRAMPLLLSLILPVVAYTSAARHFGRGTAVVFAGLVALSDIATFCTIRCDFFESLFLLFLVPVVCGVGEVSRPARRGICWAGMALTFLGKALFAIGLNIVAEAVVMLLTWRQVRRDPARRSNEMKTRLRGLIVSALVAGLPVGGWLILASRHYAGRTIPHEAMAKAPGVVALIRGLTIDYAATKVHVVGTPLQAALVWLDADVWPVNATSVGAMLVACAGAVFLFVSSTRLRGLSADQVQANGAAVSGGCHAFAFARRSTAMVGLLSWSLFGAGYVIAQGATGARFHLMYLPALWLLAALVWRSRRVFRYVDKFGFILFCGVLAFPAWGWLSWESQTWSAARAASRLLPMVGLAGVIVVGWRTLCRRRFGASGAAAGVFVAMWGMLTAGPAWWGPTAKFEPMYQKDPKDASRPPYTESMCAVDAFRSGWSAGSSQAGRPSGMPRRPETLEVLLSNYYRTCQPPDYDRAVQYARRATLRRPDDVLAWTYLGLALDESGADIAKRRDAWQRASSIKPDSAFIRERIARLSQEDVHE